MANRVEIFDVEAPANTPASAPVEVATPFDPGTVEKVWVVIPDGHSGLTGIALMVGHETVVPFNRRSTPSALRKFIEGNDESIAFDLDNLPDSGAWSALLFNADNVPHQWQLRFEVNNLQATGPVAGALASVIPAERIEGAAPPEPIPGPEQPEAPAPEEPETGPAPPPETPAPAEEPPAPAPPAEGPAGETPGVEAPEAPAEPPAPAPPAEGPQAGEPEAEREPGPGTGPGEGEAPGRPPGTPGKGPARERTRTVTTHETRPAGGWLPHGARYDERRVDQGQDFITDWRGPIIAAGDGHVVAVLSDRPYPTGFGPHYAVVAITTGPFAGHDWYIGHCTAAVSVGQRFKEGHVLAHADQGHVEGGGWCELGEAPGGVPGPMGTGARWHHLFGTRTITHTRTEHVKVKPPAKGHGKAPASGHRKPPAGHRPPRAGAKHPPAGHHGPSAGAHRPGGSTPHPGARSPTRAAPRPVARPKAPPRPAPRAPAAAPRRPPPPPPPAPARRPPPPPPKRRR